MTSFITSFFRSAREFHELSGYSLVIMVGVHLLLHWRWIFAMTKNLFLEKLIIN